MARRKNGSMTQMHGSLQIDEEPAYQEKTWIVQRVGWVGFAVIVLLALLGLFGSGPLAHATAVGADGALRVEYERFGRLSAPTELVVRIERSAVRGERLSLVLGGDYLESTELQSTLPPADGGARPDGAVLSFATQGSTGALTIVLHLKPGRPGRIAGRIGLLDGPMLDVTHWIYP